MLTVATYNVNSIRAGLELGEAQADEQVRLLVRDERKGNLPSDHAPVVAAFNRA
jgi:exonuclease III